ncbi:hypothetical protein SETIT_1G226700v2 [Setaria italica]|uniref:DUF3615 domain-containing protein n=1 Tax=Setaria italica TaxID=4555 RepID=A0A368PP52_SETIT|nr:uncharacterized protein LOC101767362 isoform X1 [Setaria italica]XP_012698801.1 uncharacterized protein LOC101767362 isoform X1 [Setaria italica]RCV07217.1 hypothetical protein SETIT_1G226700v2 [Setaria italica]RCV07218.1 hypothetical protein SETIT_1G226700v2 [Setaria italica]
MYSDHPRRSRRNPGRARPPTNLLVEEDVTEVSSNEIGPTIPDTSKFEALSLNDSPSTLDSTDGAVVCLGDMGSPEHNSTTDGLSACQKVLSPLVVVHTSDTSSGLPDSAIMEPSAAVEVVSPKSEGLRELEEYLKEHTFDSVEDAFEYLWNNQKDALAAMSQQSSLDNYEFGSESKVAPEQEEAGSVPASEQAPSVPEQGRCSEASYEEIAQNGKKWMREEVMVAFNKYIEDKDDFEDIQYEFDELQHQCFSVENYHKIFHHFNFTVKMKVNGSADWTSALFFAEVKEIFRQKIYFCTPLELYENGHCDACKKQGMDDLRHPIIGVYDRGNPDTEFPFMYGCDADGFLYDSE